MGQIINPPLVFPSGIMLNPWVAEKSFAVNFLDQVANQKVQFFWPTNTRLQGRVEVTAVTGWLGSQQTSGYIKRIYAMHLTEGGGVNILSVGSEADGAMNGGFTLTSFIYDAGSSRWTVVLAALNQNIGNMVGVTIKTWAPPVLVSNWTNIAATNVVMGAVYTTDVSVPPAILTGHTIVGGVH
jgi:hypothetical protein